MDLSLLTKFSPQTVAAKLGLIAAYTAIVFIGGAYCGFKFEQNRWEAEKFRELEKTKKLESKDQAEGAKKAEEFRQDREQQNQGKDFVRENLNRKPNVRIVKAEPAPEKSLEVKTQEGTKQDETNPNVYLTVNFMQLYDVSLEPGNSELRSGTYQASGEVSIDEGLKTITENNEKCAAVTLQLNKLLDRIEEKQRIFQGAR